MNKKIKVIELLSDISKGKNPIFRKFGRIYRDSVGTFIISYFDKQMTPEEIVILLNAEVEILEDEEEIDIQSIEENHSNNPRADVNQEIINKLIKCVKQLDKKINKE